MASPSRPVEVFCCYAREDEVWLHKLSTHLSLLKRQGLISLWHDRLVIPGTDWAKDIDTHLSRATVVLLLVSADFLASDYRYGIEMKRALEREAAGEVRVIPVLLRAVDWTEAPFAHLQALPTDAKAITTWSDQDEALADVAKGIRRALEEVANSTSARNHLESVRAPFPFMRASALVTLPSTQKGSWRRKGWLLMALVISVALLGSVGIMVIPALWHPAPGTERAEGMCAHAPTLTGPPDGLTLTIRTVTLMWEAPQGCVPDGYTVRISANYDPEAKPWIVDTGWASTFYTYTFPADGTYYWHIRACKPCTPFHPGNWARRIFTIQTSSTP